MTCKPEQPCGNTGPELAVTPPPPGLERLVRKLGGFEDFAAALLRETARTPVDGRPGVTLGRLWDLPGDPEAVRLARLWAYVAEGVAAYSELTAGESYLGTAADWTDLRRLAALTGFRPRPRVASQGWVRVDTDKGASPLVPAGTRVQAPAVPGREAQLFETVADTRLRADWAGLTAMPVPRRQRPTGRSLRFLADPGYRTGDHVLLVLGKTPPGLPVPPLGADWYLFWYWWWVVYFRPVPQSTPVAVLQVTGRTEELGTVTITFDRELDSIIKPGNEAEDAYFAYRIKAQAGGGRRLTDVLALSGTTPTKVPLVTNTYRMYGTDDAYDGDGHYLILDASLAGVSPGEQVAIVDWRAQGGGCDVLKIGENRLEDWETAPGTRVRTSRLVFADGKESAVVRNAAGGEAPSVTAYVVERQVVAASYELPDTADQPRVRVFPAPEAGHVPAHIAIKCGAGDADWKVFGCAPADAAIQEQVLLGPDGVPHPRGLILDLDAAPAGMGRYGPATGNLVPVRHGATTAGVLGSGDAAAGGQRMAVPQGPVAYDLAPDGSVVPTLEVRVDGVAWSEVPTLFGAPGGGSAAAQVYTPVLDADGGITVVFGDGASGARLPTGAGNVVQRHRTGGGTAGELRSGDISMLIGSIPGVKGVHGAGNTTGGADQDDERRLRRLVPGRARVVGRAVSRGDLVDLALAYPGVSHAAAWRGAGPPGCACAGSGEHLAFLRVGPDGPRAPEPVEIGQLTAYLTGRRDAEVPLCVAAGTVTALTVAAGVVVDPRRVPADVLAAVAAEVTRADGPLDPLRRGLGVPLDRSDVVAVVHRVPGVIGLPVLTLTGGTQAAADRAVGRVPAARYELLVLRLPPGQVTEVGREFA
ncbi:hypothetical protein [Yinghuangia seranimata]|uniref:hypothetical protein n=1 Tax=Yinghuangia seranimata TaxID=408067 RepID=UPI00248B3B97|nr:hypothetical protein [Yinghuangia seranimata]MDI2131683.1 hypothetical protein [Yinghuangia seranimata]